MSHLRSTRTRVTAALATAVACLTGCGLVGTAGRHLEPGLGTSYPVTNSTRQTLQIELRSEGPTEHDKPVKDLLLWQSFPLAPDQTLDVLDRPLAPNDCEADTLIVYVNGKMVARKAAPLCADAHGHAGWTITDADTGSSRPGAAATSSSR